MDTYKKMSRLFWQFFQFGCFTFGGGWSIIAQVQKLYVEKEKALTSQELLDITSVGRSLPGTMAGIFFAKFRDSRRMEQLGLLFF